MKIVFFGTPEFVDPVIEALDKNFDLVKIIRKPIEFSDEVLSELNKLNADLFVVAAYGKILPGKLLKIPKLGAINIHPSLLPKYRGPSPIQNTILNGDKKTGITLIKMDENVDHGPIIFQKEEDIRPSDTFESLAKRLFQISADELTKVIANYKESQTGKAQVDSKATFTKLITKDEGFINLDSPPEKEKLERMIQAFYPWPGVWTKFELNKKNVIIKLLPNRKIQVEGKKPMSFKDFKNGYEKAEEFLEDLNLN